MIEEAVVSVHKQVRFAQLYKIIVAYLKTGTILWSSFAQDCIIISVQYYTVVNMNSYYS